MTAREEMEQVLNPLRVTYDWLLSEGNIERLMNSGVWEIDKEEPIKLWKIEPVTDKNDIGYKLWWEMKDGEKREEYHFFYIHPEKNTEHPLCEYHSDPWEALRKHWQGDRVPDARKEMEDKSVRITGFNEFGDATLRLPQREGLTININIHK